jgi:hypothetical protein
MTTFVTAEVRCLTLSNDGDMLVSRGGGHSGCRWRAVVEKCRRVVGRGGHWGQAVVKLLLAFPSMRR